MARTGSRWADLTRRVLSALVLLPVALLCVWSGGPAFLLLVGIASYVLAHEWLGMCGHAGSDPLFLWFPNVLALVALGAGLGRVDARWIVAGVVGGVAATAINVLVHWPGRRRAAPGPPNASGRDVVRDGHGGGAGASALESAHPDNATAGKSGFWGGWPATPGFNLAFGLLYLAPAAFALPWLRADPVAGLANTLFVLALVWGSDIGAYLAGRLIGGPKLAPAISPGKTWSGAVGGLVSAVLAGLAVAACFSSEISPSHVIGPGIGLGIISQLGDLLESALKRHFGVKDSGHIIPGHGGLLDRLDALLAVAPVAALLAFTVGRGVVLWR